MGAYIQFGLAKEVCIRNSVHSATEMKDVFIENFGNAYTSRTDKNYTIFTLDPDFFQDHFLSFISDQYKNFFVNPKAGEFLDDLLALNKEERTKAINKNNRFCLLQDDSRTVHNISYIISKPWIKCYATNSVIFFSEGKAYLECYYDLFIYIRNLVIASSNNPIAKSFFISIN